MVKHPFQTVIVFIVLSIIGLSLIPQLSVNLNPSPKSSTFQVHFSLPESSPQIIEQLVTSRLENAFSQLSDLKEITSVSQYHRGYITLIFDKDINLDFKRLEIAALIRQIYPFLPATLSYPLLTQSAGSKENQSPFLIYTIRASLASYQIKRTVEERILPHLAIIDGIESIDVYGAEELQINVDVNYEKLISIGLSLSDVRQALQMLNQSGEIGAHTTVENQLITVKVADQFKSLEQLDNIILNTPTGSLVKLGDVSHIYWEERRARQLFRIDGQNFVRLSLKSYSNTNHITLAHRVEQQIKQIQEALPKGYRLSLEYDSTQYLQQELDKIYTRSGLSILILFLFILTIQRNIRYLIVLFSGILINTLLTVIVTYFLKLDIHLYTIAGITISFGLIVDNAIVMLDHLHRKGDTRVFLALLAASLTTIGALGMVFFLPEEDQKNLLEFCLIIVVSLSVSLGVAIWYIPSIYQLLFKSSNFSKKQISFPRRRKLVSYYQIYYGFISLLTNQRKLISVVIILGFGLPVFLLPPRWNGDQWYHQVYNNTIGTDQYQQNIRPYVDRYFGGALRLFVRHVSENSTYREPEETRLFISAELPFGHTVDQMDDIIARVEEYLIRIDGIKQFVTQIYSGQYAELLITFEKEHQQSSLPYQLSSQLVTLSLNWGGVGWDIYGVGEGFSNKIVESPPSFLIEMQGYNYDKLETQAQVLEKKLLKNQRIKEVDINSRLNYDEKSSQEYVMNFSLSKLGLLEPNLTVITKRLKESAESTIPTLSIKYQNLNTQVQVKTLTASEYSLYDLNSSPLWLPNNNTLLLGNLMNINLTQTRNAIHKKNRQYIRMVGFEYFGSERFGGEFLDEVLNEMKQELPIGYETSRIEKLKWTSEKAKRQYWLLAVLMLTVYIICSILFENLNQPLIIIVTYPISLIGLFLTFSLLDFYFDQGGYAAFIMLGGIVVNSAIFIINDLNSVTRKNTNRYNHLVIKSVCGKATPVLLTLFSTCFGLLPFLIQGQNEVFWFSLAVGTIGGIIFSIFVVFIFLPMFCMKKL